MFDLAGLFLNIVYDLKDFVVFVVVVVAAVLIVMVLVVVVVVVGVVLIVEFEVSKAIEAGEVNF